jgi:hypothetical protein
VTRTIQKLILVTASAYFLATASAYSLVAAPLDFKSDIEPILIEFCFDCHGDGSSKGNVALDEISLSHPDPELWSKVLKNVRAELMPPDGKPRPSITQLEQLESWIKYQALGIDPENPDPGQIGLRRLNRIEYQNSIRDLMGIEFKAHEEFPPDDSGYGFDNIGSVLTLSSLLLEKYIQAAELIVTKALPLKSRVPAEQIFKGSDLVDPTTSRNATRIPFDEVCKAVQEISIATPGQYRIHLNTEVDGAFNYDPGRSRVSFRVDQTELMSTEFAWKPRDKYAYTFDVDWDQGKHQLELELNPTAPTEDEDERIHFEVHEIRIEGPMAPETWVKPARFDRFFTRDQIPETSAEQDAYAYELLESFAARAFRRPARASTINRLVAIARATYDNPDKSFQEGIARSLTAALASPRFLLRIDSATQSSPKNPFPLVDEFSLATRLSYFLWSSMPDAELLELAGKGTLREELPGQIERMLSDSKAEAFASNFVGQWLHARDISGVSISARSVLARETPEDPELATQRERYLTLRRKPKEDLSEDETKELAALRSIRRKFFTRPRADLDSGLRYSMRQETEKTFEYVVNENRPILELLDSDYTFLNEPLAKHYGIDGVKGRQMRRVDLPEDHVRGGILTQGTTLVVTSNPTRTSPVKRGLFILENLLGTPPPPPADIPDLEEVETGDHEPSLREALALHRESPLCRSCHNRMDPLGFSLENFNALGMWRDQELNQPIDPTGKLITGESFENISELKRILVEDRKNDFYRCFTEKLLTFALGRGLELKDVEAVDRIVADLQNKNNHFETLLEGIILSTPFQKIRRPAEELPKKIASTSPIRIEAH